MLGVLNIKPHTMEALGIVGILLLFEFLSLLISPFMSKLTNNIPALVMLGSILVATSLAPVHRQLTKWIKERIAHNAEKKKR